VSKKILLSLLATVLPLAVAPCASAQTTQPTELMFHWGAIHKAPGQALALNLQLSDHFGTFTDLPVQFRLEDRNGNVISSHNVTISSGRAIIAVFVIGPEIRIARTTIEGDIYGAIGPDIRLLAPCIKVLLPTGPVSPIDSLTATLEVLDVLTGRVQTFAADPHIAIGLGVPQ
jgi:hypothetical protein